MNRTNQERLLNIKQQINQLLCLSKDNQSKYETTISYYNNFSPNQISTIQGKITINLSQIIRLICNFTRRKNDKICRGRIELPIFKLLKRECKECLV